LRAAGEAIAIFRTGTKASFLTFPKKDKNLKTEIATSAENHCLLATTLPCPYELFYFVIASRRRSNRLSLVVLATFFLVIASDRRERGNRLYGFYSFNGTLEKGTVSLSKFEVATSEKSLYPTYNVIMKKVAL